MAPETWHSGDLRLDVGQQRVLQAGVPVDLPRLSFDLLLALMRATPNFVSNEELMAQVWRGVVVSPETVTQRIKLLRDALGDDPKQPRYIEGLRGRGYRMIPAATTAEAAQTPVAVPRRRTRWWGAAALLAVAAVGAVMLLPGLVREGNAELTNADCIAMDSAIPARVPSQNMQAEFAYLRGRRLLGRTTVVDSDAAEQEFLHARELDQSYVPAIVGLYDARLQAANLRRSGVAEALQANAPLLQSAAALQPDSGAVQLARAMWEPLSPEEKSRLYEEGLKKEPSDSRAMTAYSELLDERLQRRADGECWLQRALHIDPLWPQARFRLAQRSFSVAGAGVEPQMLEVLKLDPNNYRALQRYGKYQWLHHGKTADAISFIERAIKVDPENPWAPHTAVVFYIDADEPQAAEALARSNPVVQASTAALLALYRGDWRKAGEAAFAPGSFNFSVFERWGVTLSLRDYALQTGQLDKVIQLISEKYGLPLDKDWPISVDNFREAGLLAHLLLAQAHTEETLRRLDQLITWIDANMNLGPTNLRPKAQALALQGKVDAALQVLRDSFQQNDYTYWWYTLKYDPTWDKLRDDSRFIAMAAEVHAHVGREREKLAEMRRNGQVPYRGTAGSSATTQQRK